MLVKLDHSPIFRAKKSTLKPPGYLYIPLPMITFPETNQNRPCKIVGFWILSWNGIHGAYFPRCFGCVSSRVGKNPQSQVDQSINRGIRISPRFKQQNLRQLGEDSRDQMLETNIGWTNVKWSETRPLVASSKKILFQYVPSLKLTNRPWILERLNFL